MFGPSAGQEGLGVVLGIIVLIVAPLLFLIGAVFVFFLWKLVIDALGSMNGTASKALVRLVGGLDASGSIVLPEKNLRFRLVGLGLLGTLIVMFVPVMIVIVVFYVIVSVAT